MILNIFTYSQRKKSSDLHEVRIMSLVLPTVHDLYISSHTNLRLTVQYISPYTPPVICTIHLTLHTSGYLYSTSHLTHLRISVQYISPHTPPVNCTVHLTSHTYGYLYSTSHLTHLQLSVQYISPHILLVIFIL